MTTSRLPLDLGACGGLPPNGLRVRRTLHEVPPESCELEDQLELGAERSHSFAALKKPADSRRSCARRVAIATVVSLILLTYVVNRHAQLPNVHKAVFRDRDQAAVTLASVDNLVSIHRDIHLDYCSIPPFSEPARNWTKWVHDFTPLTCPTHFKDSITRRTANGDLVQFHPDGRSPSFTIHPQTTGRPAAQATADKPSIAFVFIDAISRANFFRTFPKTREWVRAEMHKRKAFTFGGHVSVDRFTFANWHAFMGGINCAFPAYGKAWVPYCNLLGRLATVTPSNNYLWEHAQNAGMRTSIFSYDDELAPYEKNAELDHYFNSDFLTGDLKTKQNNAEGYITCVANVENDRLGLQYQEAVHQAYDHSGQRVFSVTNLGACHQGELRTGMVVDDQLHSFMKTLSALHTPTSVVLVSDHGNQWALDANTQSERYLPLAVLTVPPGVNSEAVHMLETNQRAITTHADVHASVLGMIDPTARPLHDQWLWGLAMPWQRSVNWMLTAAPHRTPVELGIDARMHPCVLPWSRSKRSDGDAEVVSAANAVIRYINSNAHAAGAHICRLLRLVRIDYTTIQTNEHSGGGERQARMRLQIELETVPVAGAPQHTARYIATVSRLDAYCLTSAACFWDAWRVGHDAWSMDNVEPLSTYAKYEGCMGDAIRLTPNKRYCVCD